MDAIYFKSKAELEEWLEANHATSSELLVGFYKRNSGFSGLTNAEALDLSLCFGWIDGIRKRVDNERYTNRYTPRRPNSI